VKIKFIRIGYPLYCDVGPHEGDMRVDLAIRLYLSPQEHARYEGSGSLHITLGERGSEPVPPGSTAEPSGELPEPARVTEAAGFPVLLPGDGTRELRLGGGPADRLAMFDALVADARRRYDGITFVCDGAGQRIAAVVPAGIAEFAIRHGALR
jgi:hypothetical protein